MSPIEIVGAAFGLLSVYLTIRENVWLWPTGIISVVAYAILFYDIKLYADALLQVFFFVTSLQGWHYWLYGGKNQTEPPMSTLTPREMAMLGIGLILAVIVVGSLFASYTDAHIPFWDAAISGGSVLAQILLMRKKFENWHLWIAVDMVSIGVYTYKGVYLTAGLYAVFLVMAVVGLVAWRRTLHERPNHLIAEQSIMRTP